MSIFKDLDIILAGNLLKDTAVKIATDRVATQKHYGNPHSSYKIDKTLINALVNGDENGIECYYCHYTFPKDFVREENLYAVNGKVVRGYICKRCWFARMPTNPICGRCGKEITDDELLRTIAVPVIQQDYGYDDDDYVLNKVGDKLYQLENDPNKIFYVPKKLIPKVKNLLESELASLFLDKCYEDYGQPVCGECEDYYKEGWPSEWLKVSPYQLTLATDPICMDADCFSEYVKFLEKQIRTDDMWWEVQFKNLHLLDKDNFMKLKYHPDIISDFTQYDFESLQSRQGFRTATTNIQRMAHSAIKASIKQFASIVLGDLKLYPNEDYIFEYNDHANGAEALLIIPTRGKAKMSKKEATKLFEQIVVKREFRNYLSDKNFLTFRGVLYTPYIEDYNFGFDNSEPKTISININIHLGYRKEKPLS